MTVARSPAAGRLAFGLAVAAVVVVLDQWSKWWILARFRPPGVVETPFVGMGHVNVLPILDLVLTWNRGVSFGVGNNGGAYNVLFFSGVAVLICAGLLVWMAKSENRLVTFALGLVVGGAIGNNVIDRLRFGAVVDFLYVHIGAFDWWPAFNLADSAICIGAVLLVSDSLFANHDSHKNIP